MKRYWPVFLALICWILVLAVPATRRGLVANWQLQPRIVLDSNVNYLIGSDRVIPADEQERLDQLPRDKAVRIYLASMSSTNQDVKIDDLAKRYPKDALFVAMRLHFLMRDVDIDTARNTGTVSSSRGIMPPPQGGGMHEPPWKEIIALARRGQALEPNNSFFDWMLLYALYASYQDEETYKVLKLARDKTGFNSYVRDLNLNNLEVMKRLYGSPVPADRLMRLAHNNWMSEPMQRVAYWTMDGAVLLRDKGQHARALDNTFSMLKLGRVMRTEAYLISESSVGEWCEDICMENSARIKPFNIAQNQKNQNYDHLLTVYAKQQNRPDIVAFATSEREVKWQWVNSGIFTSSWLLNHSVPSAPVFMLQELQVMLLKPLPLTLVFCAVFGGLAWRFRSEFVEGSFNWRGAQLAFYINLLLLQVSTNLGPLLIPGNTRQPFIDMVPVWFFYGLPLLVLCDSLRWACHWQRQQIGPPVTLKERFRRLSPNSVEGSAYGGIGWFLGMAVQFTFWVSVIFLLGAFCYKLRFDPLYFHNTSTNTVALGLVVLAVGFALGTLLLGWYNRPRRSETVRRSFHLIFQFTAGYFVAASVVYTIAAFVYIPNSLNFERQWQHKLETGELKSTFEVNEERASLYRAKHTIQY